MQKLDSVYSLTHRDPLITVRSTQPMLAPPTVVAAEIPVTLASAVKESQRPPLPVITASIRVLGSMALVVCSDGHTLSPAYAGTTLVPRCTCKGRAALATAQPLRGNTLPRELCQC